MLTPTSEYVLHKNHTRTQSTILKQPGAAGGSQVLFDSRVDQQKADQSAETQRLRSRHLLHRGRRPLVIEKRCDVDAETRKWVLVTVHTHIMLKTTYKPQPHKIGLSFGAVDLKILEVIRGQHSWVHAFPRELSSFQENQTDSPHLAPASLWRIASTRRGPSGRCRESVRTGRPAPRHGTGTPKSDMSPSRHSRCSAQQSVWKQHANIASV